MNHAKQPASMHSVLKISFGRSHIGCWQKTLANQVSSEVFLWLTMVAGSAGFAAPRQLQMPMLGYVWKGWRPARKLSERMEHKGFCSGGLLPSSLLRIPSRLAVPQSLTRQPRGKPTAVQAKRLKHKAQCCPRCLGKRIRTTPLEQSSAIGNTHCFSPKRVHPCCLLLKGSPKETNHLSGPDF